MFLILVETVVRKNLPLGANAIVLYRLKPVDNTLIMNKLITAQILSTRFSLFEALNAKKFRTMRSYPVRFSLHSLHFTAVDFEHAQIAILLEFVAICNSLS